MIHGAVVLIDGPLAGKRVRWLESEPKSDMDDPVPRPYMTFPIPQPMPLVPWEPPERMEQPEPVQQVDYHLHLMKAHDANDEARDVWYATTSPRPLSAFAVINHLLDRFPQEKSPCRR